MEVLFKTSASGAIIENNQVRGAVRATRSGPGAVRAKVVVDASGDGFAPGPAGWPRLRQRYRGVERPAWAPCPLAEGLGAVSERDLLTAG